MSAHEIYKLNHPRHWKPDGLSYEHFCLNLPNDIAVMKGSDIICLRPGVFQLEEGCCEWDTDETNTALMSYGGIHTELKRKAFEEEDHIL